MVHIKKKKNLKKKSKESFLRHSSLPTSPFHSHFELQLFLFLFYAK